MRELNKFISANEIFADKYILFLKIGNNGIREKKFFKNNDNFICTNLIQNFILNKNDLNLGKLKNIDHIENDFDYLIVSFEDNNIKKVDFFFTLEEIKKYTHNSFKTFISWSNQQNIFLKSKKIINTNRKKNNLTFSEEFLLYDYKFHNKCNYKLSKNKYLRKLILLFINLIDYFIDINRFSFLSTNVLVKYVYVPEFSLN